MTTAPGSDWPIAAAMLPFAAQDRSGRSAQDVGPERWAAALTEVRDAGFGEVDLTDCWLRPGDLAPARLEELAGCLRTSGLRAVAVSAIRCSVVDPEAAAANLAYSHRTIDAAAGLGVGLVSFGLHRPLSPAQRERLWFWTADGPADDPDDEESWGLAVSRLQELADHAGSVGVELSLEMYEDTFLGTAASALRMLEQIDRPGVGLNPDIGNLVRSPRRTAETWAEMVRLTLPRANYWHVKNYTVLEPVTGEPLLAAPAPMADGLIDYRWAVREALRSGFTGAFCVEHYGGDRLGSAARNRDYLRQVLRDSLGAPADHWW